MKKPKSVANAPRKKALTTPTKGEPKAPVKSDPNLVEFSQRPDESTRDAFGRNAIRSTIGSAMTIKAYSGKYGDGLEIMGLVNALSDQAKAVNDGDLKGAEVMLTTQAYALEAIFNNLAQRAALNAGEYMGTCETYLRLALKAQSQCRATLETLAAIKNPPVIYARQANVTTGPQQVNNGMVAPSHGREIESQQSKLLEAQDSERLDTGTKGAASKADPQVATVGEINRTKDGSR